MDNQSNGTVNQVNNVNQNPVESNTNQVPDPATPVQNTQNVDSSVQTPPEIPKMSSLEYSVPSTPQYASYLSYNNNNTSPTRTVNSYLGSSVNTGLQKAVNSDELIKSYIGPNYKKIVKRPFNLGALFFTAIYYFYRKMMIYGFIILILQTAMLYYFIDKPYYALIINLICCFLTNRLYFNFAIRKVSKTVKNNAEKSADEIKGMCYILGGRSIGRVFTAIAFLIVMSFVVFIIAVLFDVSDTLLKYVSDLNIEIPNIKIPEIKIPDLNTETKFDGNIVVDKGSKVTDNFLITIPSVFKETSENDDYQLSYSYKSSKKNKSTCTIELRAVSGYTNPRTLIDGIYEYYKDKNPSEVEEMSINRLIWYSTIYQTDDKTVYNYATRKFTQIYLYTYIDEVNSSNACHAYANNILNTIVMK
jgi:hypothetical protein